MVQSNHHYYDQTFVGLAASGSKITDSQFSECVFEQCEIREAQIRGCRFTNCVFRDSDLSLTDLTSTRFWNCEFQRTKITGVDWTRASWAQIGGESPVRFSECIVDYSVFMGLTLRRLQLIRSQARGVEFSEADLSESDFTGTDLSGAIFRLDNLTRANFQHATNYEINLKLNTITQARFSVPESIALLRYLDIELVD